MTSPAVGTWGPQTSLDRVFNALDEGGFRPSKRATDFHALCPVHEETTGSLHVTYRAAGDGGRVVLNCFGCNADAASITSALGLTMLDLFDNPPPERERDHRSPVRHGSAKRQRPGPLPKKLVHREVADDDHEHTWTRVESYDYVTAGGEQTQQVLRERCSTCSEKRFRQAFAVDGDLRDRKPTDFTPVLYRLPELLEAIATGQPVWLLEGEKDVHTAEGVGLIAGTNAGGAGAFPDACAAVFEAADVNVVVDRDPAGWARAARLHELLTGAGASRVRLWLPAVTAPKADFTDHIQADHTAADLIEISLGEATARDALAKTYSALARVQECEAEARARWTLADERAEAAPKESADHRRFAKRWAQESEIRWEKLADAAAAVLLEVERTAGEAVQEIAREVDGVLELAEAATRAAHDSAHSPLPDTIGERAGVLRARAIRPGEDGKVLELPIETPEHSRAETPPIRRGYVEWPEFAYLDGGIVRRKEKEIGRGEARETVVEFIPLINLAIHLDEIEMREDEEEHDPVLETLKAEYSTDPSQRIEREPRPASHVYSWHDPVQRRRVRVRVPFEDARGGDWLDTIPVAGLSFPKDRKGRGEVVRAIQVVSRDTKITTQHRGTGWYQDPTHGWSYGHFAGTITADGHIASPALLGGVMTRYALPIPTQDPQALRSAFLDHSLPIMQSMHANIGVVLLGVAYKAALERVPYSPVVHGAPGSGKTGLAALVAQHYGPTWDRDAALASLTGNGATPLAMRIAANEARDALGLFDDATPSGPGGFAGAQQRLGELIQGFYNREARGYSSREQVLQHGKRPNVTAIFTSEMPPRMGANGRRSILLGLDKGELDLADLKRLSELPSRMARARLISSMIRWIAQDYLGRRTWLEEQRASYSSKMDAAGCTPEESEWSGHVWAGWILMTTCLQDLGAITTADQHKLLSEVHLNIASAMHAATDPEEPLNLGSRILEALRSGLRAGDLYLADVQTNAAPTTMPTRLGWYPIAMGFDQGLLQHRPSALRLGYVNFELDEVLVDAVELERAVKAATSNLPESLTLDRATIRRALRDVGALRTEAKGNGSIALTVKRTIKAESDAQGAAVKRRITAISLTQLLGDEPEGPTPGPGPERIIPPMPWSPDLLGSTPPASPLAPQPEEGPMPTMTDDQAVTILQESVACLWCHEPTRHAMGEIPVHGPCWAQMLAERPRETDDEPVTVLEEPAACVWCGQPSRFALGENEAAMALHARCWDQVIEQTTKTSAPATQPATTPTPEEAGPVEPTTPARAAASAAAPRQSASTQAVAAVVADVDGVHLPDGSVHPLPEIRHLGDLAGLVEAFTIGVRQRRDYLDAGAIVISRELSAQLGLPVDLPAPTAEKPRLPEETFGELTTEHPLLLDAIADGWDFSGRKNGPVRLRSWTFAWHTERQQRVRLAFAHLLSDELLEDVEQPAQIADRLDRFAQATGIGWHVSPSSTGFDLMTHLQHKNRASLYVARSLEDVVEPALSHRTEAEFNWCRVPTSVEKEMAYVHLYDRGGSYLAGVISTELPIGDPVHHDEAVPFDARIPGYWRLSAFDAGDWRLPHPVPSIGSPESFWVATPTLDLLRSMDYDPEILEAYLWPQHSRHLDTWGTRLRDARTALDTEDPQDQAARDLVKGLYTRTIGMMGSEQYQAGGPYFHPERRHQIIAKAKANLLRQIRRIGTEHDVWPLAVRADAFLIASSDPDPVTAWPGDPAKLGRGLGQYKPERTGLMTDQLPFLTGGQWNTREGRDRAMRPVGEPRKGAE